ncbi:MAG: GYF domain-containing protein [Planctomycetaceae bacterium]
MSDQYYIRIRGEVRGPLTRDQIQAQIRRKRLGRHHELSADGITFRKAGDMPEFFEPLVGPRERLPEVFPDSASTTSEGRSQRPADRQNHSNDAESSDRPADAGDEWFYAKAGNKLGPVSGSEIRMWLSSGQLQARDLVWNSKLENWIAAGELPEFAGAPAARPNEAQVQKLPQNSPTLRPQVSGKSRWALLVEPACPRMPSTSFPT